MSKKMVRLGSEEDAATYGVDLKSLSPNRLQHWHRQQAFLVEYARSGNLSQAGRDAGIPKRTVDSWRQRNTWSFKERCEISFDNYVGGLEEMVNNRLSNPEGNRGSDVLLMASLNAKAKHLGWSRGGVESAESESATKDLLAELSDMGKRRARITHTETRTEVEVDEEVGLGG